MAQSRNSNVRRSHVLILCLFVSFFFAHSKLSIYQSNNKAMESGANSHLWVGLQDAESQKATVVIPSLFLVVIPICFVLVPRPRFRGVLPVTVAVPLSLRSAPVQLFFRPPPPLVS